jgi:hypothetical protein
VSTHTAAVLVTWHHGGVAAAHIVALSPCVFLRRALHFSSHTNFANMVTRQPWNSRVRRRQLCG